VEGVTGQRASPRDFLASEFLLARPRRAVGDGVGDAAMLDGGSMKAARMTERCRLVAQS